MKSLSPELEQPAWGLLKNPVILILKDINGTEVTFNVGSVQELIAQMQLSGHNFRLELLSGSQNQAGNKQA